MKKSIMILTIMIAMVLCFAPLAFTETQSQGTSHSTHMGATIHESTVQGYRFSYQLIDMREHLKTMPEMQMTHHLMVYITSPEGHALETAKVGYLVEGPDNAEQKLMTMGMHGGFGADINFQAPGMYTVKTKAVAGDKKLFDKFMYEVK